MVTNNAYISIKQIAASWLLGRGKTRHSKWKVIRFAAEAIRELALSDLPLIQNTILTRPDDQPYFTLPTDYMAYVSAGTHRNGAWTPVAISDKLIPYLQSVSGSFASWGTTPAAIADFWASDMDGDDFSVLSSSAVAGKTHTCEKDEIILSEAQGIIVCNPSWGANELYFQYINVGSADTMVQIPVKAQAAIEAYIAWKWAEGKRGNGAEAERLLVQFKSQRILLRARLNDLDIETIRRSVFMGYELFNVGETFDTTNTVNNIFIPATAVYSGTKLSPGLLTGAQITQTGTRSDYHATADISVTFPDLGIPAIQWVAWPATEVGIAGFYYDQYNVGPFGPTGLFGIPRYTDGFLYSEVNYPTQIPNATFTHT